MEEKIYLPLPDGESERTVGAFKKKKAVKAYSRCLLAAVAYMLSATAVMYIAQLALVLILGTERASEISENTYFVWGMQVLAMYVIAFPILLLIVRGIPTALRKKSKLGLDEFVIIFLISEAVMTVGAIISNLLTYALSELLGYEINNDTSDLIMDTPVFIVVIVAVIIGPIIEELIFRKIFIDRMSVYGDRLAIIVSSVAFGIFHGNFSQAIYATALGFILGYVYAKTRDIKYSCLLHIMLNFMGTVPTLLINDSLERIENISPDAVLSGEDMLTYYSDTMNVLGVTVVQYMLAIAGAVLFIYIIKKRAFKVPDGCDVRLPCGTVTRVAFLNLGAILFLLFCIFEFIISILPSV